MSDNQDTQKIWVENGFLEDENQENAPKKSKKKLGLVIILAALLVVLLAGAAVGTYFLSQLTILENVSVAGVDVGGMTKVQAVEAVTAAIGDQYAQKDMTVTVVDTPVTIPAEYSGGTLNVSAAVGKARRFGQLALPNMAAAEREALASGYAVDLAPYMDINEAEIRNLLVAASQAYNTDLSQSTWTINGTKPTTEELAAGQIDMRMVINLGTADYKFDIDAMYAAVVDGYSRSSFNIEAPCAITEPDDIDLEKIFQENCVSAVNAYVNDDYDLIAEANGYGFDPEAVAQQLADTDFGTSLTVDFEVFKPTYTMENLRADLFKDKLSTTTAKASSQGGRDTNLRLACEAFNGLIIKPGQVVSYNEVVGERTTEKGYKSGASYMGGKTVYVTGGGICQVSSTLYATAVKADLEIVSRENHGYAVSYLPLGIDATVSWGGPEFIFKNNSEHLILVESYAEGGHTTITFWGIDDKDYYVEFESEHLRTIPWGIKYEDYAYNNSQGYTDGEVLTSPYTGYEANTYRVKIDKKTGEVISREKEAYSYYNKRDKVVARVAAPPTPSTDPTTAPES